MRTEIQADAIRKLIPTMREIVTLWLVGLFSLAAAYLFEAGSVPQIGLVLIGGMMLERGEQKHRFRKKLGETISD